MRVVDAAKDTLDLASVDVAPVIGFFDSGVGGLAVLKEVARHLPHHRLLYYADAAYFPYGDRADAEIVERSHHTARFLLDGGAQAIVVACNTASTVALVSLRHSFAQPFIGVVPAVKPAAALSRSGRVAILATEGTLRSPAFDDLVQAFAANIDVLKLPASGLADQVERGELTTPDTLELLERCLSPARNHGVDVLVLACTHYGFLRPGIERLMGPDVTILDCAEAVARQVARVIAPMTNASPIQGTGPVRYVTSGDPGRLAETLACLQAAGSMLPPGPVVSDRMIPLWT
jgi:glutamate racemase